MDPDANLREQLALAATLREAADFGRDIGGGYPYPGGGDLRDAERLAELVLALHTWIAQGGALPAAWRQPLPEAFEIVRRTR